MPRAVITGGTGAVGGAVAAALAHRGWRVDVTGRNRQLMPAELSALGVNFHQIERDNHRALLRLLGDGADLLLDLLAYRAADVRGLLPGLSAVACPIIVSSRAVYADQWGNHLNSPTPPQFKVPIKETDPILAPADDRVDPFTQEGYGPCKVAVERTALDSGLPITVLRPSKIHGPWARNARTRAVIQAMDVRQGTLVVDGLNSVDHLSAAENIAQVVLSVASQPAARIVNCADPDTPTAREIFQTVAEQLQWDGGFAESNGAPETVKNPWNMRHPVVLDLGAARRLGYRPAGGALQLLSWEVAWAAAQESAGRHRTSLGMRRPRP